MLNRIDRDATGRMWTSRWFLPEVLGMAATLEFLLNRLALPAATAILGPGSLCAQVLSTLSRFSVNLALVLGVMVMAALLLQATSVGGVASRPIGRLSTLTMGAVLCGLSTLMILAPDQTAAVLDVKRSQWLMQLSAVCLSLLAVLGILTQPLHKVRGRHRLGAMLLLLPCLLQFETQWGLLTAMPIFQRYGLLTLIYGPILAVGALGVGAVCVLGRTAPSSGADSSAWLSPWQRVLPLLSAFFFTAVMALLLHFNAGLTTRIIYMGFDLRLPPQAEAYVFYLLSLCAWVFAVVALAVGEKPQPFRGLGLLLMGLGGCQPRTLHQLLFSLAGLFCVAESMLHRPSAAPKSRV